ncbi:MAG: helix-turn-helix transcriptional regulator [Peptococcaceae bacterium]|nr:helix-turn-helix transcriptional regulator [Peptococcaceae bacterium]
MMCDDEKIFANNLATVRKEAGLSQESLSEKIYVTRQAVSNWERGRTRPSPEMIEKIAGVLGIGVERLVGTSNVIEPNASEEPLIEQEESMMQQKEIKPRFERQSVMIGLGYAIALFLGLMVFFVVGLLAMQPMIWAAMFFCGVGIFFVVGLSLHLLILWKQPK